ncbi:MAG: hypothetical protein V2A79_10015 [Planctomycetota bacterium]
MGKNANATHRVKTTHETRMLRVQLTQEELLEAGQKMADQMRMIESLDAEADRIKKQYQGRLAEAQATLEVARSLVQDKYEIRKVQCTVVLDYTDLKCYVTRDDTAELIVDRKLLEEEKQSSLPFDGEEKEQKDD